MTSTPEDQRRYRFERKMLRADAENALRDGGPFTLPKGQGQTLKLRGLVGHLTRSGVAVEVDEAANEYVLVAV